jgi:uncharacterized membrane protein YkvA (DUF1232 family)
MWKRLSLLWVVVKGDALRLWYALGHPQSPGWLKLGTAGLLVYLVSPIDLLPDALPIIGLVDDAVLLPLAIRFMLGRLPAAVREHAERRVAGRSSTGPVVDEAR